MSKFYINDLEVLNENEKSTGTISYARLCDYLFSDMILCNNILEIDPDIIYNEEIGSLYDTENEDGYSEVTDIYQWYIVNLNFSDIDYIKDRFGDCVILLYSDKLDNYILAVDHYGTNWTYVPTDIEYTDDLEKC